MDHELKGTEALHKWLREHHGEAGDLAKYLGITQAAISNWRKRQIPAERVPALSLYTDIPRSVLRPDLYERG